VVVEKKSIMKSEEESKQQPQQEETEPKKLKSSEPDLTIFVGAEAKPFYYNSAIMANHSEYIDAMLASPMVESKTLEIRFPDIGVDEWLLMIGFLESPSKARKMMVEDAMIVAPLYDKYSFSEGRSLCSCVLEQYIKENKSDEIDHRVDIVVLADRLHLTEAYQACIEYLVKMFENEFDFMLSENHVEKLASVFAKERCLLDWLELEKDEVLSPLFARFFVQRCALRETTQRLDSSIKAIRISGTTHSAVNGDYVSTGFCDDYRGKLGRWGGQRLRFKVTRSDNHWEVVGKTVDGGETHILWRAPNFANYGVPPLTGWKAVHSLARGELTTKRVHSDNK